MQINILHEYNSLFISPYKNINAQIHINYKLLQIQLLLQQADIDHAEDTSSFKKNLTILSVLLYLFLMLIV
jgi:hypothetical protein